MMHWMTCLYRRFVFTNDDKREFFRTQGERIHAGRRVDTTDGMRLIQTALRTGQPHTRPQLGPRTVTPPSCTGGLGGPMCPAKLS